MFSGLHSEYLSLYLYANAVVVNAHVRQHDANREDCLNLIRCIKTDIIEWNEIELIYVLFLRSFLSLTIKKVVNIEGYFVSELNTV